MRNLSVLMTLKSKLKDPVPFGRTSSWKSSHLVPKPASTSFETTYISRGLSFSLSPSLPLSLSFSLSLSISFFSNLWAGNSSYYELVNLKCTICACVKKCTRFTVKWLIIIVSISGWVSTTIVPYTSEFLAKDKRHLKTRPSQTFSRIGTFCNEVFCPGGSLMANRIRSVRGLMKIVGRWKIKVSDPPGICCCRKFPE